MIKTGVSFIWTSGRKCNFAGCENRPGRKMLNHWLTVHYESIEIYFDRFILLIRLEKNCCVFTFYSFLFKLVNGNRRWCWIYFGFNNLSMLGLLQFLMRFFSHTRRNYCLWMNLFIWIYFTRSWTDRCSRLVLDWVWRQAWNKSCRNSSGRTLEQRWRGREDSARQQRIQSHGKWFY
jgi:hypothetical protein